MRARHFLDREKSATACGMKLVCFYPMAHQALPADSDDKIDCTDDAKSVTCERCIARAVRPTGA